jgi:protein dithiol:quinone oxidoreductase
MKTSKPVLIGAALASLFLLGVGLFMQHVMKQLPCPLCVLQRYAFAAIALICLATAALPQRALKGGALLGLLAALSGAGVAIYHLWIISHPSMSCGIDPLETSLNTIPTAKLMPFLFYADGLCTTVYPPIFGLSMPLWALIWFALFAITLGWIAFKRSR